MEPMHFSAEAKIIKEIHPEKMDYTSGNGKPENISSVFWKESFFIFWEKGTRKKMFYVSENRTFRPLKMKKKTLLKCFLYFSKLYFLGEPLRVFCQCFFRCFHFTINFYYCFRVFLSLIAFVHFINVSSGVFVLPLNLLLFF